MKQHLSREREPVSAGRTWTLAAALVLCGVSLGWAAERMVLCEEFTSIGCDHCPVAGEALSWMLRDFGPDGLITPGTFTLVQMHWDDPYQTTWTVNRRLFYDVTASPVAWFDGMIEKAGSVVTVENTYNHYVLFCYNPRLAIPTDVTIAVGGELVGEDTYEITAEICVEPDGTGKTMRINMVQVLDYYPPEGGYHRNCCLASGTPRSVTVAAGECQRTSNTFALGPASADNLEDVKFIVWAQEPLGSGPAEVYNAAVLTYPFDPLPPMCCPCPGDFNDPCDDVVDITDFTQFAAAFGSVVGDASYNRCADLSPPGNPDNVVNVTDFAVFASQFGQPCP